jgi:tetratricopeptide (TPR) repeat protein
VPLIAPERRDAAVAARAELGVVFAALDLYQLAVARRAVTALAAAPGADDPLVVAGLAIARAVLDARAGHHDGKALSAAYFAARALDADELAARALAELVDSNSVEGSDVWLRSARSDADRMRARRPAAAAGLYLKVAKVTDEHGDHPAALELVGRARALLAPTDPRRATASAIEGSVRIGQGDVAAGNAAYADAVALMTSLRGATHPDVAQLHSDHAAVLLNVDRGRDALPFVAAARAALASAGDEESGLLDRVRGNLGAVLIDVGYAAEARPLLETARAHLQVVDPDGPDLAHLDGNLALIELDGGKPALALAMLGDALAVYERAGTADELEAAGVYYNLAAVQQASDPPAAIRAATRAAAIYGARAPGGDRQRNSLIMIAAIANATGDPTTALAQSSAALAFPHPAQDAQTQAWAQLEEARALIALHKWPAEARRLLTEARAAYAAAPLPKRVAQVDALLRTLPR